MHRATNSANGPLLAIIDSDARFVRSLCATLGGGGYRCASFTRYPARGLRLEELGIQAVLLDLGAPDGERVAVLREIRRTSLIPILVVAASALEQDKVSALDAGADDYVTKPVASGELLARVRVALRHGQAQRHSRGEHVRVGELHIDLVTRVVILGGRSLALTPTDYRLLALLARNVGRVVSREQLLQEGWGPHAHDLHYLRVYMARLRRKLDPERTAAQFISTEAGIGYRLLTKPRG